MQSTVWKLNYKKDTQERTNHLSRPHHNLLKNKTGHVLLMAIVIEMKTEAKMKMKLEMGVVMGV